MLHGDSRTKPWYLVVFGFPSYSKFINGSRLGEPFHKPREPQLLVKCRANLASDYDPKYQRTCSHFSGCGWLEDAL